MSKLRGVLAIAVTVVCALSPLAQAEVRLKASPIVTCYECYNRWADFNGDGLDDLLVRNRVYLNLGGRLASPVTIDGLVERDEVVVVADVNGDEFADLFVILPGMVYPGANPDADGPIRMYLGDGFLRFTERPMPQGGGSTVQIADFTGDGVIDMLRWNYLKQELSILRGNGDATFTLHQTLDWPHDQVLRDFTPADINGDGRLDIVTPYGAYLHVYYAQPDGKFGSVQTRFTRIHLAHAKFADLNGDAKTDILFNDMYRGDAGITVLIGDGTGRFPAVARYQAPRPVENLEFDFASVTELAVGDFIAGGAAEVAVGVQGDGFVVILGMQNDRLVELGRQDVPAIHPEVRSVRFRADRPEVVAFGQVLRQGMPVNYETWLIETEGTAAEVNAPAARRRARAIGRSNAFTGGRYHLGIASDCPVDSLRNLSLAREGMFIDVGVEGPIERAEAAYIDDEVFLRLYVRDGNATRILEGNLDVTPLGLSGKLFEWKNSPCGGWQVHRVTATLSH